MNSEASIGKVRSILLENYLYNTEYVGCLKV